MARCRHRRGKKMWPRDFECARACVFSQGFGRRRRWAKEESEPRGWNYVCFFFSFWLLGNHLAAAACMCASVSSLFVQSHLLLPLCVHVGVSMSPSSLLNTMHSSPTPLF